MTGTIVLDVEIFPAAPVAAEMEDTLATHPQFWRETQAETPPEASTAQPSWRDPVMEVAPALGGETEPRRTVVGLLEQYFGKYAVLPSRLPLVLALWSLATYLQEDFDCFPYLAITSPTKRCGKTRVAELLEFTCADPLRTVGITVAALFRIIERKRPTLIIDEAESLGSKGEKTEALREILNAGYKRGQKVIRCVGGNGADYEPREFETFCPKVLVLIGTLPETLSDRCIPLAMKRRTSESLARFRSAQIAKETRVFRRWARLWARKHGAEVKSWYETNDLMYLEDREAELWLPLFAVCTVAAPERREELEIIARRLSGMKTAEGTGDLSIRLLQDIRHAFNGASEDRLSTGALLSKLNGQPESPWPAWNHDRGLNPHNLGLMLRAFQIRSGTLRLSDDETAKGYYRDDFRDAWSRYLSPPVKRHTVTPQIKPLESGENGLLRLVSGPGCDGSQNEENANVYAGCDDVTGVAQK
jgi:hypothetical protein